MLHKHCIAASQHPKELTGSRRPREFQLSGMLSAVLWDQNAHSLQGNQHESRLNDSGVQKTCFLQGTVKSITLKIEIN